MSPVARTNEYAAVLVRVALAVLVAGQAVLNAAGALLNAVGDGGYSTGTSFNLIRKINLVHLTTRSQVSGARSSLMITNGYQTFDTQTSISARNLSYQNRYVLTQ